MKIISPFKDYYDACTFVCRDESIVYARNINNLTKDSFYANCKGCPAY